MVCSAPAAVNDRDPDCTGLTQGCVCNFGWGEKGVCVCLCVCVCVCGEVTWWL